MTDLDFESDQLLSLMTDALHAGPGSPAWHAAVARLGDAGVQSADEMKLLMQVRENLESGRSYRTIRAGNGFTRDLMNALQTETPINQRRRSNTILLVGCIAAVLLTMAAVTTLIWRQSVRYTGDSSGLLINTVASVEFENGMPVDWQAIGGLSLTINRNLLMPAPMNESHSAGGGIAWKTSIPATEPFTFSATCRTPHLNSGLVSELFITDEPVFDSITGVTPHEVVWLLQSQSTSVVSPTGQVLVQVALPAETRNSLAIRVTSSDSHITVEQDGKRLWAGASGLDAAKPRTVGIRFLMNQAANFEEGGFSRLRVNMRQPAP